MAFLRMEGGRFVIPRPLIHFPEPHCTFRIWTESRRPSMTEIYCIPENWTLAARLAALHGEAKIVVIDRADWYGSTYVWQSNGIPGIRGREVLTTELWTDRESIKYARGEK